MSARWESAWPLCGANGVCMHSLSWLSARAQFSNMPLSYQTVVRDGYHAQG